MAPAASSPCYTGCTHRVNAIVMGVGGSHQCSADTRKAAALSLSVSHGVERPTLSSETLLRQVETWLRSSIRQRSRFSMTDSSGAEIGEKPAPASRIDIERPSVLAANVLLCTLPVVVLILIPMLVKGLVETLGLSEREAGFVATSQTLGYTTGTLVAYFVVGHCNW